MAENTNQSVVPESKEANAPVEKVEKMEKMEKVEKMEKEIPNILVRCFEKHPESSNKTKIHEKAGNNTRQEIRNHGVGENNLTLIGNIAAKTISQSNWQTLAMSFTKTINFTHLEKQNP